MRFGLCTDIRNVREVQEAGFDYIEGKLNQFALWSEEEFEKTLELFASSSISMETCSLLLPKTMAVLGPEYDEKAMEDDEIEIAVQINGKTKTVITVAKEIAKEDALAAGKEALGDKLTGNIVKEIYVPGRIINIVVK